MPTAYSILPERFEDDRWKHILEGLQRAGYAVEHHPDQRSCGGLWFHPNSQRDLLVTWTRNRGGIEKGCLEFERLGGRVLVCEEAHIRHPLGPGTEQHFCISIHDHNRAGKNATGDGSRWASWGIELKPWRTNGHRVLVRQQRGIGSARQRCPDHEWHKRTAAKLSTVSPHLESIPITHPKNLKRANKPVPASEELLRDAWVMVTWNSHEATIALLHGIPVMYCAPNFFLEDAAFRMRDDPDSQMNIISPPYYDRLPAFEKYAWCQWSLSELKSGEAFQWLL